MAGDISLESLYLIYTWCDSYSYDMTAIPIQILMCLMTFRISMVWGIESEEWMVFPDGQPAKYWSPTLVCAVLKSVRARIALSGIYYNSQSR